MKIDKVSLIFTLLLIVFVLVLTITSFTYTTETRQMPLLVSIPTLVMASFVLISETFYPKLLRRLDVSADDFIGINPEEVEDTEKQSRAKVRVGLLSMYMWMISYCILVFLTGFLIATGVYLVAFLKVGTKVSWLKTIIISTVVWGLMYGVFELFMKVNLFKGILFGEILPSI
ncbi:tripartite tricarboxylate transporter TctB family protein [Chloroflexota bacterium]